VKGEALPPLPARRGPLRLYYITDRRQFAGDAAAQRTALLERIAAAAMAGVDYIQLREKVLPIRELEHLATGALLAARASGLGTKLLINGRVDVAIACGADGVHLPADGLNPDEARAIFGKLGVAQPIIGVSCHTLDAVRLAESRGADFAVFGPVFEKSGAKGVGVVALRNVCQRREHAEPAMPVLALGGVTANNARDCLAAGAQGIAGIRLFQAADVQATVTALRSMNI
jgi:thiamine-phosphate pyrophosphorylase